MPRPGELLSELRDCLITGYEPLVPALELPDPDDRHVLAAAIKARAQVIVTNNRTDFPAEALRQWDIDPKDADEFVLDQIGLSAKIVWGCVQQIANSWRKPPGTVGDVLASLEPHGLVRSVAELRAL